MTVTLCVPVDIIIQISCTSSLSGDTNRLNYFQLLPSAARLPHVLQRIFTEYNWRSVALIVQSNLRLELVSFAVLLII